MTPPTNIGQEEAEPSNPQAATAAVGEKRKRVLSKTIAKKILRGSYPEGFSFKLYHSSDYIR